MTKEKERKLAYEKKKVKFKKDCAGCCQNDGGVALSIRDGRGDGSIRRLYDTGFFTC